MLAKNAESVGASSPPHQQREPAPSGDFVQVARDEGEVEQQEWRRDHRDQRPGHSPMPARHRHHEQRCHQHVAGHCDTIGVGQRLGTAEAQHQGQHRGGE
jgi:hypothetical protein